MRVVNAEGIDAVFAANCANLGGVTAVGDDQREAGHDLEPEPQESPERSNY